MSQHTHHQQEAAQGRAALEVMDRIQALIERILNEEDYIRSALEMLKGNADGYHAQGVANVVQAREETHRKMLDVLALMYRNVSHISAERYALEKAIYEDARESLDEEAAMDADPFEGLHSEL